MPAYLRAIPVDIPLDSRLLVLRSGEKLLPTASPAIATAQWTFVAELLGACRRQHKQLAVLLTISMDPGLRRYNRTKGLLVEPDCAARARRAGRVCPRLPSEGRSIA